MDLLRVKYSKDKTVPHLYPWAGTSLGDPKQDSSSYFKALQWNTGGLNQAKKTELHKILEDGEIDVFTYWKPM
jgi:hypothetical protein